MRILLAEDEKQIAEFISRGLKEQGEIIGALEVGQSADEVSEALALLLLIMALAYPAVLIVASLGGVFLAGKALSPIDEITRTARSMSAADRLRRLNLDLPEDEVGRLARTFDEMLGRLDDAFQRQRQFTADASHELRTPLTIMKGQIDVSLQRDRQPADYQQVLRSINGEVDRHIRLSASLLTLTRADSGQIPVTLEDVALPDLLASVSGQVRPVALGKGIKLEVATGPQVIARADQDLLIQLVLNLLDNAVKYTPPDGQVTVGWGTSNGEVTLRVTDTGPGIAPEHLPYIFDRFYRADEARSRDEGGVGLGLAICRWIAEAHGGSIRITSTPGQGSTFIVSLPALPQANLNASFIPASSGNPTLNP